jgi:hypothetical protein
MSAELIPLSNISLISLESHSRGFSLSKKAPLSC